MSQYSQSRRWWLSQLTKLLLALISLLVAAPVIGYAFAPLRRRLGKSAEPTFENLGPLSELTVGKWLLLPLDVVRKDGWEEVREHHSIYVRRTGDSESQVAVLSPICPHLGCPIQWSEKEGRFQCPCHGGLFDVDGNHIGGPPPRGMDPLPFKIVDGRILVEWEDFKIGVSQRIAVQV
jgi:Rieske Fe-S protein